MADASSRGWGKGWPTPRYSSMKLVTAGGIKVTVHKDLAPLIGDLLDRTMRGGYKLVSGWCWGYSNRPIAGTSTPSNHSWGLAVDLNAPTNPMMSPLRTDMPRWMVEMWKDLGFRWGGDYTGRKDAMHFEFMGTPADATRLAPKPGGIKPAGTGAIRIEGANVTRTPGERIYACSVGKGNVQINEKGEVYAYGTTWHGGYNTLKPEQRLGTRTFVAVEPDPVNAVDGYRLIADDGAVYVFPLVPIVGSAKPV